MDVLIVLDTPPAFTHAAGAPDPLEDVQYLVNGAVDDGMNRELKPGAIGRESPLGKLVQAVAR